VTPGSATPSLPARLGRSFYRRPSPHVAPDLLGRLLVRPLPGDGVLMARIVEVEAYQEDDPASHSYRGRTVRTEVMFGPPGHLYVYFSYGNHWCMNVVTGVDGEGSAVLLRAAEPLEGLAWMREARGVERTRDLCSGPGKLAQAFGVTKALDGLDLVEGTDLYLSPGEPVPGERIGAGPRVGISVATERPWRFVDASAGAFLSRRQPPTRTPDQEALGEGDGDGLGPAWGSAR
jgi:DNA-3-methyladenine glycosylase